MFGKEPYRLRKGFERYSVDDFQWGQLMAQQRPRKADVFKKATMNDKEEFVEEYASQCSSKQGLAEKCGKLPDFVQWFRRSKSRPSLTGLALNGAPKLVGKKTSNRKRSNKRKAEIESTVNLSVENDRSTPNFNFQSISRSRILQQHH